MGKYNLQRLRLNHSIPMDDMVAELRPMYPKLDKPLLSKAINEGYGVQLRPDALKALGEKFDPEGWDKRREKDRHRINTGVRCRLNRRELEAFTWQYRKDGYKNANECVRHLILRYIEISDMIEEERCEREKQLWNNLSQEDNK